VLEAFVIQSPGSLPLLHLVLLPVADCYLAEAWILDDCIYPVSIEQSIVPSVYPARCVVMNKVILGSYVLVFLGVWWYGRFGSQAPPMENPPRSTNVVVTFVFFLPVLI